jgi:predicted permease
MWIDRQDLLYTIRSARHEPVLSMVAVLALSLGIGLNAGVFTLLNSMFLSAPTQTNPAGFVQIYPRYEGWFTGAAQFSSFTTEDYDAIRSRSTALEEAAASQQSSAILDQAHRRISTLLVTCNYFHVFGIAHSLLGRLLGPNECDRGNAAQVVVLSEPFWRSQFNADPHIVGGIIQLNGLPFTVIGVVPGDDANLLGAGVIVPYTLQPILDHRTNLLGSADSPWLGITARLRKGHSRADAQAELATILRQQDRAYVERKVSALDRKTSVVLTNGSFIEDPAMRDLVLVLMALILGPLLLVLLLACSNVTMLFLSRAVVRRGEIAVRLALGIGRARLIRMLLMESMLTVLIAAPISIALAYRVPLLIMNVADPKQSGFLPLMHPNWHVFGYLAVLIVVATAASSLAPMQAAWKLDLTAALKGREGSTTIGSRTTGGLIVAQIAMSFVLLGAAVLFGRLPGMVTAMDPGFETRHTLAVPLDLDISSENRAAALAFYDALESRIRTIPGVQSLAYESLQPFRGQSPPNEIRLAGQEKGQGKPASVDSVSTEFFSTFGIRVVAGRSFLSSDETSASAASVVLVSQAFAKQFWFNDNPIGKVITTPDDKRSVVAGVVADTRSERFGITDAPRLYTLRDPAALDGQMYVRFTGNTNTMENAVRDVVRGLDPTRIEAPQTIWESLEARAKRMRSLALIVVVMASIAVLLALTGVYGVLSFVINQRRREVGIRMALGANRPSIFCSILLRGCRQIALGLVCGIALAEPAAWTFTRLLKNSPLPLRNFDALVYGIASGLLVAVSLSAMYLPAMRATQVDPMAALRTD